MKVSVIISVWPWDIALYSSVIYLMNYMVMCGLHLTGIHLRRHKNCVVSTCRQILAGVNLIHRNNYYLHGW